MNLFDHYLDARVRGDRRIGRALKMRPFTCVAGFTAMISFVGCLVYTMVYSDTAAQQVKHAMESALVVIPCWVIAGLFYLRERRSSLSLRARRVVWIAIVVLYCAVAIVGISLSFDASIGGGFYLMVRLAVMLPVAILAWQLLQEKK